MASTSRVVAGDSAADTSDRVSRAPALPVKSLRCTLLLCVCCFLGATYSYMGTSDVERKSAAANRAVSASIAADMANGTTNVSWTGERVEARRASTTDQNVEVREMMSVTMAPPPGKLPTPTESAKVACAVRGGCSEAHPTWATSAWSECTGLACDGSKQGERKRQAWCSGPKPDDCDLHAKPNIVESCSGKLSGPKCKEEARRQRSDPKERVFDRNQPPEATKRSNSAHANATMEKGVERTSGAVTGSASASRAADLANGTSDLSKGRHFQPKPVSTKEKGIEVRRVNFTIAPPPIILPTAPTVSPKVPGPSEAWDLVIVIPSHSSEFGRRAAVRATWFQYLSSTRCKRCHGRSVKPIFVVGQEGHEEQVEAEVQKYNDVARLKNFSQLSYYSDRAEKTRQCIKYAVDHFSFRLLLKTDTDSWIYFDRLFQYLDEHDVWSSARVYAGNFRAGEGAKPVKEKGSKWYDPVYTKETGMEKYPKHAKGAGYILSRELCEFLSYEPNRLVSLPSEDVSVGFWLFAIRHQRIDLPVSITTSCSCPAPGPSPPPKKTDASKDVFIDHYVSPDLMFDRWQSYQGTGYPCACPEWQVGDWTGCLVVVDGEEVDSTRKTCGDGERRRTVKCSTQVNGPCDSSRMPAPRERCQVKCPADRVPWNVSDWSPCPKTCVPTAVQTRTVVCAVDGGCSETRPVNERRCPACTWSTSAWSECTGLVCDGSKKGERKRKVWCSGATLGDCDPRAKPPATEACSGKLAGPKCKEEAAKGKK